MKHLILVTMPRDSEVGRQYEAGTLGTPQFATALGKLMAKLQAAGKLLDVSVLMPQRQSARVRGAAGQVSVTDGPFIESKEIIGGYIMVATESRQEAIEIGRAFMQIHVDMLGPSYQGAMEIRQLSEQAPGGALK